MELQLFCGIRRQQISEKEVMKRYYLERFIFVLDYGENEEIEAFNGTVPQALMMINGAVVNISADSKRRCSLLG